MIYNSNVFFNFLCEKNQKVLSEEDVNTMSTLDAHKSKREKINGNQNTKCMKKVHERFPDAKCKVVKDMSNCIKMCEQIGK